MASEYKYNKVNYTSEDEEFNQVLSHVGGRGNIYLVGDAYPMDSKYKYRILEEFVAGIFRNDDTHRETNRVGTDMSNGDIKSGVSCKAAVTDVIMQNDEPSDLRDNRSTSHGRRRSEFDAVQKEGASSAKGVEAKNVLTTGNLSARGRTISCAIIIFIFRHAYVNHKGNRVCLEEILKDVKTRTKRNGVRPALLGLVYADIENAETRDSVMFLEQTLRSVFTKHPHGSIWAGHFISKAPDGTQTIKRHICTTVHFSQSPDNMPGKQGCFPLLQRWFRGEHKPNITSNNLVQEGNPESTEEGIPLQMRSLPHS
ncbi:uncharacterized protein LOC113585745 [Electrophorus electricus]|uniref:uncharacterized protein LOC113585745 n=1 Tax=Electrophorus electricus TaxID=8005 RepID=UPI0015D05501|nr:uncharacterized protein LOC113585745 [Electrophorus electricus]